MRCRQLAHYDAVPANVAAEVKESWPDRCSDAALAALWVAKLRRVSLRMHAFFALGLCFHDIASRNKCDILATGAQQSFAQAFLLICFA